MSGEHERCLTRLPATRMYLSVMASGAPLALALFRVRRGEPRPSEEVLRRALAADREQLRLPPANATAEMVVAGPYAVLVDGSELDEYVVWER